MKQAAPLAEHLAPDTITRLERAAELRHKDAVTLMQSRRGLSALYLFGFSAEMCLAAACFRNAGYSVKTLIGRDDRLRVMTRARNMQDSEGEPLMNSDPHPIVGWARFLAWQKSASRQSPTEQKRLDNAIRQAEIVYRHWRPELRYKTVEVTVEQVTQVFRANVWFLEQRGQL